MAEMKPKNPNLTHEEQREIVNALITKHQLDTNMDQTKAFILGEALYVLGFGRNAGSVNALRFVADLYESEIPGLPVTVDLSSLPDDGKVN